MDSCEKVYPFLLSVRRVVAWPGIYRGCTKKCHPAILPIFQSPQSETPLHHLKDHSEPTTPSHTQSLVEGVYRPALDAPIDHENSPSQQPTVVRVPPKIGFFGRNY